ncbi:MAG: hypothetical protein V4636_16965 [Pseudomonadota bacterium]
MTRSAQRAVCAEAFDVKDVFMQIPLSGPRAGLLADHSWQEASAAFVI